MGVCSSNAAAQNDGAVNTSPARKPNNNQPRRRSSGGHRHHHDQNHHPHHHHNNHQHAGHEIDVTEEEGKGLKGLWREWRFVSSMMSSTITPEQLDRQRAEFWDTRVSGAADMWNALHLACDTVIAAATALRSASSSSSSEANAVAAATTALHEAIELANTMLRSAGLQLLDLETRAADSLFTYDERGFRYQLPLIVACDPPNLVSNKNAVDDATASATATATATAAPSSDVQLHDITVTTATASITTTPSPNPTAAASASSSHLSSSSTPAVAAATAVPAATAVAMAAQASSSAEDADVSDSTAASSSAAAANVASSANTYKLYVRFSNSAGASDDMKIKLPVPLAPHQTVAWLQDAIARERQIDISRQLLLYQSKLLPKKALLSELFKGGTTIQCFVKSSPTNEKE